MNKRQALANILGSDSPAHIVLQHSRLKEAARLFMKHVGQPYPSRDMSSCNRFLNTFDSKLNAGVPRGDIEREYLAVLHELFLAVCEKQREAIETDIPLYAQCLVSIRKGASRFRPAKYFSDTVDNLSGQIVALKREIVAVQDADLEDEWEHYHYTLSAIAAEMQALHEMLKNQAAACDTARKDRRTELKYAITTGIASLSLLVASAVGFTTYHDRHQDSRVSGQPSVSAPSTPALQLPAAPVRAVSNSTPGPNTPAGNAASTQPGAPPTGKSTP